MITIVIRAILKPLLKKIMCATHRKSVFSACGVLKKTLTPYSEKSNFSITYCTNSYCIDYLKTNVFCIKINLIFTVFSS